ncbi:hypothetical protein HZ326_22972 [Fusarium oxysporum f. sp. albedinis]|nr:hypothetical protein HZ326_22972 [Fusarium oxysporum f. sp. albedinis]
MSGATMQKPMTLIIFPMWRNKIFSISFIFFRLALLFLFLGHKLATSQPMKTDMAKRVTWVGMFSRAFEIAVAFEDTSSTTRLAPSSILDAASGTRPMLQQLLELEDCARVTSYCSSYIRAHVNNSKLWNKHIMKKSTAFMIN